MAKRVITTLDDDLDGSEANETITFSINGAEYEIDLNDAHASQLHKAMSRYISRWAIESGIPVSARGRIKVDVMERYAAAH